MHVNEKRSIARQYVWFNKNEIFSAILGLIPRKCPKEPLAELFWQLQTCETDADCWPRVCCPDGVKRYCRTSKPELEKLSLPGAKQLSYRKNTARGINPSVTIIFIALSMYFSYRITVRLLTMYTSTTARFRFISEKVQQHLGLLSKCVLSRRRQKTLSTTAEITARISHRFRPGIMSILDVVAPSDFHTKFIVLAIQHWPRQTMDR